MINGRQIRAARGLLGWDASKLADEAGITRETISRIETDTVQPQEKSLTHILRAFDNHGVEFTDNSGVRIKPNNVEILEDTHGFSRLFDIIFGYVKQFGGDLCISNVDENLFSKYRLHPEMHRQRMTELKKTRDNFRIRVLVAEGDYNFVGSNYAEYRWLPKMQTSRAAFYVFGPYLALISFDNEPPPLIILLKTPAFAQAYRDGFNMNWENAMTPPDKDSPKSKRNTQANNRKSSGTR